MDRTQERTREIDAAVADIRAIEERDGVTRILGRIGVLAKARKAGAPNVKRAAIGRGVGVA